MKTVEVEIFNTRFSVREHENEHYLQALAAEVDACIHAICAASEKISPLRAAIMAAYLFADEAKQQQGKAGPKPGSSA
jgi:cell division protein ZapA (FtsZ GTPase activity inhibitor)